MNKHLPELRVLSVATAALIVIAACVCRRDTTYPLHATALAWFAPGNAWYVYRIEPFGYVDTFYVRDYKRGSDRNSMTCEVSQSLTYYLVAAHSLDSLRQAIGGNSAFFNTDTILVSVRATGRGAQGAVNHHVIYSGQNGAYYGGLISFFAYASPGGDLFQDAAGTVRIRESDTLTLHGRTFRNVLKSPGDTAWAYGYFQKDVGLVGAEHLALNGAKPHSMVLIDWSK